MDLDNLLPVFMFFVFMALAVFIGSLIVKVIKYGSLKAAMFNAPIERTVGEVVGNGPLTNIATQVHILGGGSPDKPVGLEFTAKNFAGYQMFSVTLSVSEARKLAGLLQAATAGYDAT